MINISVIGTGYVGLVSGACLAEGGNLVTCMDSNPEIIHNLQKGIVPIYEPTLDKLIEKNNQSGNLQFTFDMEEAVKSAKIIFIAVGTPSKDDGNVQLNEIFSVAKSIAQYSNGYKVIVNKSTVPVGTAQKVRECIQEILNQRGVDFSFDMVSNPEFLREGSAVKDFMEPDRITIGTESEESKMIMREIYTFIEESIYPRFYTNLEVAEMIKYASNAFLATKITFINEIAELCEAIGANVQEVSKGMGLDKRIGQGFLKAGPGYGGSCFPKDTNALVHIGSKVGVDMSIIKSVIKVNHYQKLRCVKKIISAMKDVDKKIITVLGLAFKAGTDDVRDSPAIIIIRELIKKGAIIRVYDPVAIEKAKKHAFNDLEICYGTDEYDAMLNADAIVVLTEWSQFSVLDIDKVKCLMKGRYFFDFRNVYDKTIMEEADFLYYGIGK